VCHKMLSFCQAKFLSSLIIKFFFSCNLILTDISHYEPTWYLFIVLNACILKSRPMNKNSRPLGTENSMDITGWEVCPRWSRYGDLGIIHCWWCVFYDNSVGHCMGFVTSQVEAADRDVDLPILWDCDICRVFSKLNIPGGRSVGGCISVTYSCRPVN
jgi:hypothetical protein